MTVVDIAVRVAEEYDFHVHPCRWRDKKPTSPHGFHDAVRDPSAIRKLWSQHWGPLVGVATGPKSDLCIVDVDPFKEGSQALDWLDEHAPRLPETFAYQTRSGGSHFAFRNFPGVGCSQSRIAHSVDVRGEGGYAVAWWALGGPVICNAPRALMPEWLAKAAMPPPAPEPVPYDGDSPAVFKLARITGLIRYLTGVPGGRRHSSAYWVSRAFGEMVRAGDLSHDEAVAILTRATAAWRPGKTVRTILDGLRKGEEA